MDNDIIKQLIFVSIIIIIVVSCSGIGIQGEGGKSKGAIVLMECKAPKKRYASEIRFTLDSELKSVLNKGDAKINAELSRRIIKLTDYSQEGLDLDLLLYRICEISNNRGFTAEETKE